MRIFEPAPVLKGGKYSSTSSCTGISGSARPFICCLIYGAVLEISHCFWVNLRDHTDTRLIYFEFTQNLAEVISG